MATRYVEAGAHDWEIMLHQSEHTYINSAEGKPMPVRIEPQFENVEAAFKEEVMAYKIYLPRPGQPEMLLGDMLFNLTSAWMYQGNFLTEQQQIQICMRIYQLPIHEN